MPNIDHGHYFLTVLVPVLLSAETEDDGTIATPANQLRKTLALMPTTGGDPAPELHGEITPDERVSPFARNTLNHFARFAVIEDVNYNGRQGGDGIIEALRKIDPATPQSADHLSRPYLLFTAEFDPNPHGAPEPDVYLDRLWTTMQPELRKIFRHCYRFVEVETAGDFVRYIKRCQIETTMPFGDYWAQRPPFKGLAAGPTAAAVIAAGALAGYGMWRLAEDASGWRWLLALVIGVLVALAIFLVLAKRQAARSFPAAPNADLETILKALYLQRGFVAFATAHQGDDPATLHAAFGAFVADIRPAEAEPTQPPAVVGT